MQKVLFVAAEAAPFAKTGGLGDVIGSLPKTLRKRGLDVRVMLPKYGCIPEDYQARMQQGQSVHVSVAWRRQYCGLLALEYEGVPVYFLDNEYYFNREGLYGFYDDAERFAFFCRAALDMLPFLGFKPEIIHCHDWHTGMIPVFLREFYEAQPFYTGIKTCFTIHNLKYQGIFSHWILHNVLGLGDRYFTFDKLEQYDRVNFMKAGLVFADQLTTVSPTYAEEIKTAFYGEGLETVLQDKADKLAGVLNGLNIEDFNPQTDSYVPHHYGELDADAGKSRNKKALLEKLGLTMTQEKPLVTFISRLVEQKGVDLLLRIMEELLNEGKLTLVVLGQGDPHYEEALRAIASRHTELFKLCLGFDEGLARQLYAAADIFLMPSLFEPCGLSQMIAMRYGCLPVVRETGGLMDTVLSYNTFTGQGNGFSFTNYNAHDFLFTMRRALDVFQKKEVWSRLRYQAMTTDTSWDRSAAAYQDLYSRLAGGDGH